MQPPFQIHVFDCAGPHSLSRRAQEGLQAGIDVAGERIHLGAIKQSITAKYPVNGNFLVAVRSPSSFGTHRLGCGRRKPKPFASRWNLSSIAVFCEYGTVERPPLGGSRSVEAA